MAVTYEVVERFRDDVTKGPRGLIIVIAEETRIPLKTLRNLYYGRTDTMRYKPMKSLENYYLGRRRRRKSHKAVH